MPRRPLHDVGQGRRAGRAAPGAARRAAGSGLLVFVADGPLPPPLPEGNEFPSEAELRGLLRDAGFALEEPRTPTSATVRRSGPSGPTPSTPRSSGGTATIRRSEQAQEQSRRVGRLLSDGALRAWLGVGGARRRPDAGECKETLAKNSLHSYGSGVPTDATPLEPAVQVTDVRALRALAHPLRNRLLGQLRLNGPATASQLGRVVGESSGSTSYHLRQLAAYGFVEEVEGQGTARERWWRARHRMTSWQAADLARAGGRRRGRRTR